MLSVCACELVFSESIVLAEGAMAPPLSSVRDRPGKYDDALVIATNGRCIERLSIVTRH